MLGKKKKKDKKQAEEVEAPLEESGETEEAGDPKKKKKKKKGKKKKKKLLLLLIIVLLLAGAAAVFFLRGRGEGGGNEPEPEPEETVEAPSVYALGEMELTALPVYSEDVLVYAPEPPEPAEGEEPITAVTYRYEGYTDPRGILTAYMGLLTAADVGFVYVDEELTEVEEPDLQAESGTACLAKAAGEAAVMSLQLSWTPEILTVVTDTVTGQIRKPRPESMTLAEAEDYVRSMNPEALGLTGESMEDYNIYPLAGSVLVDGKPCLHVSVYSINETSGTNEIAGEYFIAADKSQIYTRDIVTGAVRKVG